jgi:hypothetical protein
MIISKNKDLSSILGEYTLANGGSDLSADSYSLMSGDLRTFHTTILPKLLARNFDPS